MNEPNDKKLPDRPERPDLSFNGKKRPLKAIAPRLLIPCDDVEHLKPILKEQFVNPIFLHGFLLFRCCIQLVFALVNLPRNILIIYYRVPNTWCNYENDLFSSPY